VPLTQVEALGVDQATDSVQRMLVIEKWLSHPHQYHVGQPFSVGAQFPCKVQRLGDNFAAGEVAMETHLTGGAEGAAYGATHLSGDAGGAAALVPHQYCLDSLAVCQAEQVLAGVPIGRLHCVHHLRYADDRLRRQSLAQRSGQVGHLVEGGRQMDVEPLPELATTVPRLTPLLDEGLEGGEIEGVEMDSEFRIESCGLHMPMDSVYYELAGDANDVVVLWKVVVRCCETLTVLFVRGIVCLPRNSGVFGGWFSRIVWSTDSTKPRGRRESWLRGFVLESERMEWIMRSLRILRITHHASRLTPHASRLTPHASRLTPHASRLTIALALMIPLLATAWTPAPQLDEIPVVGQVTNGTPGGVVPADLPVALHVFSGMEEMGTYTTTLTAEGSFHFDGLTPVEGDVFMAQAVYQGVTYVSDMVAFEPRQREIALPVTVYETTEDFDDIRITQVHLFISREEDHVQVGEYRLVGNAGDRTYVGVMDSETGRRTTLSITLPAGADGLHFEDSGLEERFLEKEGGFADTEPIPPGDVTAEVLFSYHLPYRDGMLIERVFDAPVASIVILLSQEAGDVGMGLEGEGIVPGDALDTQMGLALSYTAGPLAAGEVLAFRLVERAAGEQTGGETGEQRSGWASETAVGLAALAVAVAVVYWLLWRSPTPGPIPARVRPLVEKIAALDADFEAGRIAEKAYRQRRKALRRKVRVSLGGGRVADEQEDR